MKLAASRHVSRTQKCISSQFPSFCHRYLELAVRVFLDEKRIERYDERHSTMNEERWNAIGMVGKVLFVVFTERGENVRIISARRATREEEKVYYDGYEFR